MLGEGIIHSASSWTILGNEEFVSATVLWLTVFPRTQIWEFVSRSEKFDRVVFAKRKCAIIRIVRFCIALGFRRGIQLLDRGRSLQLSRTALKRRDVGGEGKISTPIAYIGLEDAETGTYYLSLYSAIH
jgi:hypothetical protein